MTPEAFQRPSASGWQTNSDRSDAASSRADAAPDPDPESDPAPADADCDGPSDPPLESADPPPPPPPQATAPTAMRSTISTRAMEPCHHAPCAIRGSDAARLRSDVSTTRAPEGSASSPGRCSPRP